MNATPARLWRTGRPVRAALALSLLAATTALPAQSLVVPPAAGDLAATLRDACPGCIEAGFLACGTPDVQLGRRWAGTALQGTPPRAYLVARAPTVGELMQRVRAAPPPQVRETLADAVTPVRLVVFDEDWRRVRVLAPSAPPSLAVDATQHACLHDRQLDAGCCLGDGPRSRGCLPKADPPSATLQFDDPASGETLRLRLPAGREVTLRRRAGEGPETLYWCQSWARARLR
ncbi:MAG: hypothetical protein KF788_01235 [Piscinibacter sp.]|nr:hypothetical protein [Piscinibacter sp.]